MVAWVVIYRRPLRQPRKSCGPPRLFLFNIPTCKCAVRIPDASAGPSNIPTFGFPYLLPSSASRNPFVCHSYATFASRTHLLDKNSRGVGVFFPFWNSSRLGSRAYPRPPIPFSFSSLRTLLHSLHFFCAHKKDNPLIFNRFHTLLGIMYLTNHVVCERIMVIGEAHEPQ